MQIEAALTQDTTALGSAASTSAVVKKFIADLDETAIAVDSITDEKIKVNLFLYMKLLYFYRQLQMTFDCRQTALTTLTMRWK